VPERRCVGCGRVAPKPTLVRLALVHRDDAPARVVIDALATMPGRGAYLCRARAAGVPAADCLRHATTRGGLARALRAPAAMLADALESTC
jgi:predicted RNA-binding protein YlxR (DUF448 family)